MNSEQYEFSIGTFWLPAIFNGDLSGIDEIDARYLDDFLEWVMDDKGLGDWSMKDQGEFPEFAIDAVTDLGCKCVTLIYSVFEPPVKVIKPVQGEA